MSDYRGFATLYVCVYGGNSVVQVLDNPPSLKSDHLLMDGHHSRPY